MKLPIVTGGSMRRSLMPLSAGFGFGLTFGRFGGEASEPSTEPLTIEDGTTALHLEDGTTELTLEG
jgi:hypothetical protein